MNASRHTLLEAFPLIATSLALAAIVLLRTVLRHSAGSLVLAGTALMVLLPPRVPTCALHSYKLIRL